MFNRFNFCINFCEKRLKTKINLNINKFTNRINSKKLENTNKNKTIFPFDASEAYFKNLPQSVKKIKNTHDLLSISWLEKIGKKDAKNTQKKSIFCNKNLKNYSQVVFMNFIKKENEIFFYKNKTEILQTKSLDGKIPNHVKNTNFRLNEKNNEKTIQTEKSANIFKLETLFVFKLRNRAKYEIYTLLCYFIAKLRENL